MRFPFAGSLTLLVSSAALAPACSESSSGSSGAAQVTVTYDPTQSYPATVFVDLSAQVGDDTMSLHLSDVGLP